MKEPQRKQAEQRIAGWVARITADDASIAELVLRHGTGRMRLETFPPDVEPAEIIATAESDSEVVGGRQVYWLEAFAVKGAVEPVASFRFSIDTTPDAPEDETPVQAYQRHIEELLKLLVTQTRVNGDVQGETIRALREQLAVHDERELEMLKSYRRLGKMVGDAEGKKARDEAEEGGVLTQLVEILQALADIAPSAPAVIDQVRGLLTRHATPEAKPQIPAEIPKQP